MKITLENLTFKYENRTLFSNISAELSPGRLHVLAGANGTGKSTLIKLLCNYLKPFSGKVLLDGRLIGRYSDNERAKIMGVIWQSVEPGLDFSVWDMVQILASARFPRLGSLSANEQKIIGQSLERFGLSGKTQQRFSTLSGGEKQQLMLAAAAALSPDILLLDEPTSALDPANCNMVMDFLEEYAQTHTVLAVTHDLTLPSRSRGELWLLDKAGNFYAGKADELLNSELLSKVYNTPAVVENINGRKRVFFD